MPWHNYSVGISDEMRACDTCEGWNQKECGKY